MSKVVKLEGNPEDLMRLLLGYMRSLPPLVHISDLVQNGIDAGANDIKIEIVRKKIGNTYKTEKVIISDNGHGFLESFERYSKNIGNSLKNKASIYLEKSAKGESLGEFCIGMQGFRSVASELQVINLTKEGMKAQDKERNIIDDPNFSKMFKWRKMRMFKEKEECTINEEGEFEKPQISHGVTYILSGLTANAERIFTLRNIVSYLSSQKRSALLKLHDLKIEIIEGVKKEFVKPIRYKGEKIEDVIILPNQDKDTSKRGFGELKPELVCHPPKVGSKIAITVKGEPIYLDLCQKIEEFDNYPWNSKMIEGTIEYERLTKQPGRVEIQRDSFYDAFLEMMLILEKIVEKKVKEVEKKYRSKHDAKLLDKLEDVFGKIKREIDLNIFGPTTSKKVLKGSLARIQAFPEKENVEAFGRKTLYVRAYDDKDNELTEEDGIEFFWEVTGKLGTIIPKGNEATFEAGSIVGVTEVTTKAKDKSSLKELPYKIEIVITHPIKPGSLYRAKIMPGMAIVSINGQREFQAIAEDINGNIISKKLKSFWKIVYDGSDGAKINKDYGETIIFTAGKRIGQVKLHLEVKQGNISKEDYALMDVREPKEKGKRKPKKIGLPPPKVENEPAQYPMKHSWLEYDKDGKPINLCYNEAHRDYKEVKDDKKKRERYIANLYAKELAFLDCKEMGMEFYGERFIEVLSRLDMHWR